MTNEIREILDKLEYVSNEIKAQIQDGNIKAKEIPSSLGKELRLNSYSAKILLNYITNLQEIEKEHQKINGELRQKINILQQRIDKAIEYINKYEYQRYCPSPYEKDKYIMREEKEGQDLLNILRGNE